MGDGLLLGFSDMIKPFMRLAALAAAFVCANVDQHLLAFELDEKLSISGVLAGAGQCLAVTRGVGAGDNCRAAVPFQPEVSEGIWQVLQLNSRADQMPNVIILPVANRRLRRLILQA